MGNGGSRMNDREVQGRPRRIVVTGGSGFIGTHLVNALVRDGNDVVSLDKVLPTLSAHRRFHRFVDILDYRAVLKALLEARPDVVVHLAARTDTFGTNLSEYAVNTVGTRNIAEGVAATGGRTLLINTSTQFVAAPGVEITGPREYKPHTVYGESKAAAEESLWGDFAELDWTIIRPTNIWGPWHPRYPHEFWHVLAKGLYLHPRTEHPVIRSYGYVETVADQIRQLLDVPRDLRAHRVFYVGDAPLDLLDWVNEFSIALIGRPARTVPVSVLKGIATVGDLASWARLRAPLTTDRLRSMTESYVVPMRPTFEILGRPRLPWREGVARTVEWLRSR
jgi:nucleoside-diphosphate-sugar epimerase